MKKLSLLMTLVLLVSLFGVASPAPVAADPLPGTIVQIPVIQVGGGWETWIQVQNVGTAAGKFGLLLLGYTGEYCGPQCATKIKLEMSGLVPVGGAWTYKLFGDVTCGSTFTPKSGILVSLSPAQWAAAEAGSCSGSSVVTLWKTNAAAGQKAAVSVNRIQTGAGGTPRAAAYTGIYGDMEGMRDPRTGAFMYYAPQLFDTFSPAGWSSKIWIQNSGTECTSLEIWFMRQQDCLKSRIQEVLALCPGETIDITPDMAGFLGSAWIRASQPLGVIVDEYNANGSIFMSYRGMPASLWNQTGGVVFNHGSLFNFAPLIYREYNGWNTGIVVQNLSSIYNALVKVYFLDNSGDIIDTIVDWICPRGSQTFYLPAINNLPGQYVGQARVESQNWWGPGDPEVDAPYVLSVVNLVNYNTGQGAAYNTFPKDEAVGIKWVGLPFLAKDKQDPHEPSGTRWTSEIAMTNVDMIPGVSVWRIDFFDQNGLLYSICQTLNEKQVDYIKLANIGIIPPGWLGSAVISWQCSSKTADPAGWVGSLGVVVVEKASGYPSGDLTKAYEGYPLTTAPRIAAAVDCPECGQLPATPTPPPPTPTPTPYKVGVCLNLEGIVLQCSGNTAVNNTVVAIRNPVGGQIVRWTATNSVGYFQFKDTAPCSFYEGVYNVSVQDNGGWNNLSWWDPITATWREDFELIDTDNDGDIDSADLFAKTNLMQLNFVGRDCVVTPCARFLFNQRIYADANGSGGFTTGEALSGGTVTLAGTGAWTNFTFTGTSGSDGRFNVWLPANATFNLTYSAMFNGVPIICPKAGAPYVYGPTACGTAANPDTADRDMLDCSSP